MEPGIYIAGLFLGAEPKYDKDGNRKGDVAGIAVGLQSYKVSVKSGVPANLAFSDPCRARVKPNIFNGNVYYSAEELLLDDD